MIKKIFLNLIPFFACAFLLSMDQLENYIQQGENADKLSKELKKSGNEAEELVKKDEALQWYGKAVAVTVPPRDLTLEKDPYEIQRDLQGKAASKIAIAAMQLKAQKKYAEAIKIYKYAGDVIRFKNEIAQLEALQKSQEPELPKEGTKEDWIFITEMPEAEEKKTDYWRIVKNSITKKTILELNKSEKDKILFETFEKLIQKAKKENIPFFLVMLEIDDEKTPLQFYEGKNAFLFLAEKGRQILKALGQARINESIKIPILSDPSTLLEVESATIFVMGDDDKFTQLNKLLGLYDLLYLNKFFVKETTGDEIFKFKDILSKKGEAQLFVAELFNESAQKKKEINQKQTLLQYARQWYDWALKYLQPGTEAYNETERKRNAIPYEGKVLSQEFFLIDLMQNLQVLTSGLEQVAAKL